MAIADLRNKKAQTHERLGFLDCVVWRRLWHRSSRDALLEGHLGVFRLTIFVAFPATEVSAFFDPPLD